MSKSNLIPGEQRNHLAATEVSDKTLGRLIAMHGWEVGVIFYMKEGEDGGMGVTCTGLGLRNGRIAQEFMHRILEAVGDHEAKEFKAELDKELVEAEKEMAEGPNPETNTGRVILGDKIERISKDKMRQRGRKPS